MLESFSVWRDAEQTGRAWGGVEYLFPQLRGEFGKGKEDKVGVIVHSPPTKHAPAGLRYGHMTWGFRREVTESGGHPFVYEFNCATGEKDQRFFQKRRCLIPVDLWHFRKDSPKGRFWYSFHPAEKIPMAFAGIYNTFTHPSGAKANSVAILGLSAGEFYQEFDDRMPGIFLPGPEAIQYLDANTKENKAWELVRAFPADRMMVENKDHLI